MPLTFADPALPALPLHLVHSEAADAFRARLPEDSRAWLAATGWSATSGELALLPGARGVLTGAAFGMGDAQARKRNRFAVAKAASSLPAGVWELCGEMTAEERAEAALGWLLSQYHFDRYRRGRQVRALLRAPEGIDAARIEAIAAGEAMTRDLINTPAADMGPQELEDAATELAALFGATVMTICGDHLLTHRFPMIHAVGRASPREPRLIDLRWGTSGPLLTLVGKGVCFDTGGLDIKPASGMLLMKKDMGGAATVLGLARMIMATDMPLRLRVLIPAVENAISGNSFRPGDILTSRKGLTVEVNNTDAEGRLVLADALALACEDPPDLLVSMATLTGAARVALGHDLAPLYTDDDALAATLAGAAARVRDPIWRMPFWDPYEPTIEPGIADLDNAPSGGMAGSITAALFLRRFVDTPRYAHFDIYGHHPSDAPARQKGGIGQGARAILEALPSVLDL